ncbi:sirohydrochlorin ferrochelatase [Burkholderiales bacterium]|nr:sirohydrochlorin ferrochelatase [Burkholderiales bacterium]
MRRRGVILFAHGARDPAWSAPFESLAARFAALAPDIPVTLAYLEFMTPDLATAARSLVDLGCDAVTIVPAFLGVGGHVRRDVPVIVASIERDHPGLAVRVAPALGEVASVQDAMARAAVAAVRAAAPD